MSESGMAVIRCKRAVITVESGSNLMEALLAAEVPVASSCGGDAVCGKCLVTVIAGANHLSRPASPETALRDRLGWSDSQRLSCQTLVLGDTEVDTPYW